MDKEPGGAIVHGDSRESDTTERLPLSPSAHFRLLAILDIFLSS